LNARTARLLPVPFLLLLAAALAPSLQEGASGDGTPVLGEGEHRYTWVEGGLRLPKGDFGKTHGVVTTDSSGRIYVNTDTEKAVHVFGPEGEYQRSFGSELAGGLHGMVVVEEEGEEFLYVAHVNHHAVAKTTMDGEVLWSLGPPEASGLYAETKDYRPTSIAVAPDGRFFVADGYGANWVHRYGPDREYLGSFGGPGTEPGQFRTCHGLWVDTRVEPPVLIVCDRENGRLQTFDLDGGHLDVIEGFFRRPCNVFELDGSLVVADLAGRITILDDENELVCHLGENPDKELWARFQAEPAVWRAGEFIAPHGACWTPDGDLVVVDWNYLGRVSRLERQR